MSAEYIERYLVLRSMGEGDGGVINILTALNSVSVYGLEFMKYPFTKQYGHDNSLIVLVLKSKSSYDSSRWLLIETVKRLLSFDKTSAYLPKPYKFLTCHPKRKKNGEIIDGATLESIDEPELALHYMGLIQERIDLKNKELAEQKSPEYLENY